MRNLFVSLIAAAGLFVVGAPLAAQAAPALKIGYIDTRRVIQEAPGADSAQITLQREMQGFEAQLKAMQDSLQAMVADYQSKQLVMSADAKTRAEQAIRQKEAQFQQRATQLREQAALRQQQLMEPIMQHVDSVIAEVRKAEGFGIVFDAASDVIVSADPSLDLTEKVLARLKAAPTASRQQ
ncbi:MAG TPA: OmpH family outer membrane protein [Longimicrobiales bacterium]|nr:OmpH family outer membrane protein [Longimicrobiales bacterium]